MIHISPLQSMRRAIVRAARIWLALLIVAIVTWLLIAAVTTIERVLPTP
jgi:hypothetical protein